MNDAPSLSAAELDRRIAIVRDNIRQLIEQAAAFSGAGDEEQTDELEKLTKQREALEKK
jgi:predicted ATPase